MNEDVEVPTRHIPTREEITESMDYWQTNDMMNKIHGELLICKQLIDDIMDHSGWDTAYFDVNIDLKVKFGHNIVQINEEWKALEP